jgi:putative transcriptional regulator
MCIIGHIIILGGQPMTKLKNNLRILMAKHKMNIKDVHEKTGLSRTTISKLYNETSTTIGFETILELCKLFNCEVEDLLYLEKETGESE